ncbi:MAG: pilin [bacterium]
MYKEDKWKTINTQENVASGDKAKTEQDCMDKGSDYRALFEATPVPGINMYTIECQQKDGKWSYTYTPQVDEVNKCTTSNTELANKFKTAVIAAKSINKNPDVIKDGKCAVSAEEIAKVKAELAKIEKDTGAISVSWWQDLAGQSLNPGGSSLKTPHQLIAYGIKFEMVLMGAIALALYIWAGMLWMTSGGNSERKDKAMKTLLWVTIGLVVVFSSYAMLRFVFKSLIT